MQWQLEGDRPIYQQLVDQIMMQIVSGQRKAGDKVPAVRELAAEAGVNPNTCRGRWPIWSARAFCTPIGPADGM